MLKMLITATGEELTVTGIPVRNQLTSYA